MDSNAVELEVSYETDAEYRNQLRRFCQMKCVDQFENDPSIDAVSRDENLYDEDAVSKTMNLLYDKTRDSTAFRTLYELAAGRMFSTDPEIGLCILMSYDYFRYFYTVYLLYETLGENIKLEEIYCILLNKLS